MNFKKSPLSIINKEKRETNFFKGAYKRRTQFEIESYKNSEDEHKKDTIRVQFVLILDRISI